MGLWPALLEDPETILQKAIPPLVVLRLADLVPGAEFGQRCGSFESFKDDLQFLGAAPFATFHFGGFFQAAHSITFMQPLTGGGIGGYVKSITGMKTGKHVKARHMRLMASYRKLIR